MCCWGLGWVGWRGVGGCVGFVDLGFISYTHLLIGLRSKVLEPLMPHKSPMKGCE